MRDRGCGLLLGLLLLGGIAQAEEPAITAQNVFAFYKSLTLLTPEPLVVSWRIAVDCMAPAPSVMAEEESRFGPHTGAFINLYVNDAAKQAMAAGAGAYPLGAVIVKEKVGQDAVGGMVKRPPGFDPANGDWEYFYASRGGAFSTGRLANCIACHAQAKSADYVFALKEGATGR
jgi:hypothetical protein